MLSLHKKLKLYYLLLLILSFSVSCNNEPRNTQELLDYFESLSGNELKEAHPQWVRLVGWSEDTEELDVLLAEGQGISVKSLYASLALFKIRYEPERHLYRILHALEYGNDEEKDTAWRLVNELDTSDVDYIYIIEEFTGSFDPLVRLKIPDIIQRVSGESSDDV